MPVPCVAVRQALRVAAGGRTSPVVAALVTAARELLLSSFLHYPVLLGSEDAAEEIGVDVVLPQALKNEQRI